LKWESGIIAFKTQAHRLAHFILDLAQRDSLPGAFESGGQGRRLSWERGHLARIVIRAGARHALPMLKTRWITQTCGQDARAPKNR